MLMNKKSMVIPIVFLVFLTLVLTVTSLFYLITNKERIDEIIKAPPAVDKIIIEEGRLNFYLQSIFDNAVRDVNKNDLIGKFIENYAEELSNYKDENENYYIKDLEQVENQLTQENIELNNEKLVFTINLELTGGDYYEEGIFITYNYEKNFEKVFK